MIFENLTEQISRSLITEDKLAPNSVYLFKDGQGKSFPPPPKLRKHYNFIGKLHEKCTRTANRQHSSQPNQQS